MRGWDYSRLTDYHLEPTRGEAQWDTVEPFRGLGQGIAQYPWQVRGAKELEGRLPSVTG